MVKGHRIDNSALLNAGLELMRQNGTPLTKAPSKGRSMLYTMPNGESVRVRTCNDHILITLADKASDDARLNIEGTDWLLIVMPEEERTHGKVIGYLVPTEEAVAQARQTNRAWLDSNPNTKGDNRTWNLWFDSTHHISSGFAQKWAEYRLQGEAFTISEEAGEASPITDIKAEVDAVRQRLAKVAGVSSEAVKISIDFGV